MSGEDNSNNEAMMELMKSMFSDMSNNMNSMNNNMNSLREDIINNNEVVNEDLSLCRTRSIQGPIQEQ